MVLQDYCWVRDSISSQHAPGILGSMIFAVSLRCTENVWASAFLWQAIKSVKVCHGCSQRTEFTHVGVQSWLPGQAFPCQAQPTSAKNGKDGPPGYLTGQGSQHCSTVQQATLEPTPYLGSGFAPSAEVLTCWQRVNAVLLTTPVKMQMQCSLPDPRWAEALWLFLCKVFVGTTQG
jgi:hypothetical protein